MGLLEVSCNPGRQLVSFVRLGESCIGKDHEGKVTFATNDPTHTLGSLKKQMRRGSALVHELPVYVHFELVMHNSTGSRTKCVKPYTCNPGEYKRQFDHTRESIPRLK